MTIKSCQEYLSCLAEVIDSLEELPDYEDIAKKLDHLYAVINENLNELKAEISYVLGEWNETDEVSFKAISSEKFKPEVKR